MPYLIAIIGMGDVYTTALRANEPESGNTDINVSPRPGFPLYEPRSKEHDHIDS